MNRFIAKVFSGLLTYLHVLIALILVAILVAAFIFDKNNLAPDGSGLVGTVLTVMAIFFIYVAVVGFLATVISINENLNEIRVLLSINRQPPEIQTIVRSYEEPQIKTEPKI